MIMEKRVNKPLIKYITITKRIKTMKRIQLYRIYTLIMCCIFITSCNKGKEIQSFASLQETKLPPLEKIQLKMKDTVECVKFTPPIIKFEDPEPYSETNPEPRPRQEEEKPYIHVEMMPEFSGGTSAMTEYIRKNLRYPPKEIETAIQGRVILKFIVTKEGEIKNIRVIRGISEDIDKESIRLVEGMPLWKPGKQNGEFVDVYYTIPITFKLDSK